jgi:5-methylcytosine-specific restriction endonuclease McrA
MIYSYFKKNYLIDNLVDCDGYPKHTRLVKRLFYRFADELLNDFGFNLRKCSICNIDDMWNGKPFIMELDHINRITNDSRISNLRVLCPICHTQTDGYKNRMITIEEYHRKMVCDA